MILSNQQHKSYTSLHYIVFFAADNVLSHNVDKFCSKL